MLSALPATAAAQARSFHLPSEPVDRALLRFGVQAGVSVGGVLARGCTGSTHAVSGVMSPAEALQRLLPAGCTFRQLDERTFRVTPREPALERSVAPPPEPAPSALEELVVTAEKRPEPLIGSPYPVSALSAATLDRLGARTFGGVSSQFVGVSMTNLGPGRDKIFLRGLSDGSFTGRTQSAVGLYLDDTPITYNAPDPDLQLVDVDRIEVLRGPQGTLYGSGSIGGIVRIVTAQPDPTGYHASVALGAAATKRGAPSYTAEAMLNAPLPGTSALRAVVYSDQAGGWLDNPRLRLPDSNLSRRWGARLAVYTALPDRWTARLTLVHQSIDTRDAQYTEGGGAASRTRDVLVREPSDNDFGEAALTLNRAGRAVDLKVAAAFVRHRLESQYDATGAFPALLPPGPTAFDEIQIIDLSTVEAQASSSGTSRLRWLLGVFGSEANEHDAGDAIPQAAAAAEIYRRRDRLEELAVYGEASYEVRNLRLTLGMRAFATHRSSHAEARAPAGLDVVSADGEATDRGFAPKLRLSYRFGPQATVYVEAQKGYRSGGFNLPFAGPSASGLPPFHGDSLWNYEAGAAVPFLDRQLSFRAAAFHTDWHRIQTDQFLSSGLPLTVDIGDVSENGVEAELIWRSGAHWRARLNALADDGQVRRVSNAFPARTDSGLPGVPGQMESADVAYRWSPAAGLEASVSGQVAYIGRSHVTFDAGPLGVMGGYAVGRLSALVDSGAWRLEGYVDNLADTKANSFAFGNPFSRPRGSQVTPLRPRTAGFDLSWRF